MKINNKSGFTLIELMAVVAVIMVLIGLLMPALSGTRKQAKRKQALAECIAIRAAIVSYKMDNRKWPIPNSDQQDADMAYSDDNHLVLSELTNSTPSYLQGDTFKVDDRGNAIDPWGNHYIIKVDTDYDGSYTDSAGGGTVDMPNGLEISSTTYPLSKF